MYLGHWLAFSVAILAIPRFSQATEGGRTSSGALPKVRKVTDFPDLLKTKSLLAGPAGQVRLGIDEQTINKADSVTVYCLSYEYKPSDKHDTNLGPVNLSVFHEDREIAIPRTKGGFVGKLGGGDALLFIKAVRLEKAGLYRFRFSDLNGKELGHCDVQVKDGVAHSWMQCFLEPEKGLRNDLPVLWMPPLPACSAVRLDKPSSVYLPSLCNEAAMKPFTIIIREKFIITEFNYEVDVGYPPKTFGARWWLNGKPIRVSEDVKKTYEPAFIRWFETKKRKATFALTLSLVSFAAKEGDILSVQIIALRQEELGLPTLLLSNKADIRLRKQ